MAKGKGLDQTPHSAASDLSLPQVNILYKSIAGRYRPVRVADGPITARYRFIKNASWGVLSAKAYLPQYLGLIR